MAKEKIVKVTGKVTLDTFYQEFKDSQDYLKETLEEIKKQVKHTNGRVTSLELDSALAKRDCEILRSDIHTLEKYNEQNVNNSYKNKSFWISIISISLAILTFLLKIRDII